MIRRETVFHGCNSIGRCIVDRPDASSLHQIGVIPEETFHSVHVSNVLRIVDKGRGRMPYPGIGIRVVDIEEY